MFWRTATNRWKKKCFLVTRGVHQLCFASSVSDATNAPVERGFKIWGFVPCVVPAGLCEEMVACQWACPPLCLHHIQAAVVILFSQQDSSLEGLRKVEPRGCFVPIVFHTQLRGLLRQHPCPTRAEGFPSECYNLPNIWQCCCIWPFSE